MSLFFQLARSGEVPISLEFEPVYNILNSIALLGQVERLPALDAWVIRTAAEIGPEQRQANRLIFECLAGALLPSRDWPDFPSYLADLAAQEPATLAGRARRHMAEITPGSDLRAAAQALLSDPPSLHDLLVSHLRAIWDGALAAEWKRALPPIQKTVAMIKQRPTTDAAAVAENLRAFVAGAAACAPGVERIICAPSPHVGRYVTRLLHAGALRLFFNGPLNYAVVMRTSPVGRAELLTRLAGLGDETRLRILELFAGQNELSAQEIMARLDLSQSGVSRHMKQLAPYVAERRGEGASKFYSLAPAQFDLTFHTLRRALSGAEAEPAEQPSPPANYPHELKRFLDEQGRATAWPTKRRDQLQLLEYLAAQFELGRDYSEKEVNAVLIERMHPIFKDYAIIRRELYNYGYLDRERDGSRYWKLERPRAQAQEEPR